MPLYEYRCESCEHEFCDVYSMDERELPCQSPCPNCGVSSVQKQISTTCTIDAVRMGRVKPRSDFRDRMKEIKKKFKYDRRANIKDY